MSDSRRKVGSLGNDDTGIDDAQADVLAAVRFSVAGGPFAGSGTGEGNEDVGVEAVVEEGERVEAVPPPPTPP